MINAIITLYGDIDSLRRFHKVIDSLNESRFLPSSDPQLDERKDLINEAIRAVRLGTNPSFTCNEDIPFDIMEQEIRDENVAYVIDIIHDNGANMCKAWSPDRGEQITMCDSNAEPYVMVSEIEAALKEAEPLSVLTMIRKMVNDAKYSMGDGMPPFSVSGTLQRYVARAITISALSLT
jgi:hypothetical protein